MGKRFIAILGATVAVGAGLGVWTMRGCHAHTCDPKGHREAAWNPALRAGASSAMGHVPWANETLALFDHAAADWQEVYGEVCAGNDRAREAKLSCLENTLEELGAVARLVSGQPSGKGTPDSPTVTTSGAIDQNARIRAPLVVAMLEPASSCEHVGVASGGTDRERARAWAASALASTDAMAPAEGSPAHELDQALMKISVGESAAALPDLKAARDRVIRLVGDKHPELARYDEALAAADRARGKLREALKLHDRAQHLREAAYGVDAPPVAISLLERARTELEGGELVKAKASLARAIAIREKAHDEPGLAELREAMVEVVDAGPEDPDMPQFESLVPRPGASPVPPKVAFHSGIDPGFAVAAKQYADAIANAGDEPSRTALAAAIGLADTTKAKQAARTAISLFQAMPELDRADMQRMWDLSR